MAMVTGVWGWDPQRGPGAEPLVGVRGRGPLKLKAFWLLNVPQSRKICPVFLQCSVFLSLPFLSPFAPLPFPLPPR